MTAFISKRRLGIVLITALTFVCLISLSMESIIEYFLIQSKALPQGHTFVFDDEFEEVNMPTDDGNTLNGIHFKVDQPKGIILYFHGNREHLVRWGQIGAKFTKYQYDVLVVDYRGYGKSTGKLTPENIYSDALLWYKYGLEHSKNIILFGRSLGTGVSSFLSDQQNVKGHILETPYPSMTEVINHHAKVMDVSRFVKFKLENEKHLQNSPIPTIVLHGTNDKVVPYRLGLKLFDRMHNPNKKMITIKDGSHNNLSTYTTYWQALDEYFEKIN